MIYQLYRHLKVHFLVPGYVYWPAFFQCLRKDYDGIVGSAGNLYDGTIHLKTVQHAAAWIEGIRSFPIT